MLFLPISNSFAKEQVFPPIGYLQMKINNSLTKSNVDGKTLSYGKLTTFAREIWNEMEFEPDNTENWEENPLSNRGDCEDFVLTLRKKLIEENISNKYFSIAIVKSDVENMNHAVLIVKTSDRGNFIFDNKGLHNMNKYEIIKFEENDKWFKKD